MNLFKVRRRHWSFGNVRQFWQPTLAAIFTPVSAAPANILNQSGKGDIGDFIITKYETNRRDRFYIAKIIKISGTEIVVSTLRKHPLSKSVFFICPNILDEPVISREQIVRQLKLLSVKRGKYFFSLGEELKTLQ